MELFNFLYLIFTVLIAQLFNLHWKKLKLSRQLVFLESQLEVLDILRSLCCSGKIERAMLLKMTKGPNKNIKEKGHRHTATALIDFNRDIKKSTFRRYKGIFIDDYYKDCIKEAYESELGYREFKTDDEKDCQLKRIYLSENIKYSRIYTLKETKDTIYYCSFSSSQDFFDDEESNIAAAEAIGYIRGVFITNFS